MICDFGVEYTASRGISVVTPFSPLMSCESWRGRMVRFPSRYVCVLSVEFCQELRAEQAASVCRMVVVVVVVIVVAVSACKWIFT